MRRWLIALAAVFASGALASVGQASGYGDDERGDDKGKVTICHVPPGNPGNAHTIAVGAAAVAVHPEHGD